VYVIVYMYKLYTYMCMLGMIEAGRDELTSSLKLCSPLTSIDDVTQLKDWLSETWVNLAMVNYPYPASFLEPLPAWPIKVMCAVSSLVLFFFCCKFFLA